MTKTVLKLDVISLSLMIGFAMTVPLATAATPVPEYDSLFTEATGYVVLSKSDDISSSSWNLPGNWKDAEAPNPEKKYYVGSDRALTVCTNKAPADSATSFNGKELVVAGRLLDYGARSWHAKLGGPIILLPGSEYFMNSAGNIDEGTVEIRGTAGNPSVLNYGRDDTTRYTKNCLVELVSEPDAVGLVYFRKQANSANTGGTFNVLGSQPKFKGTLQIDEDHRIQTSSAAYDWAGGFEILDKGLVSFGSGDSTLGTLVVRSGGVVSLGSSSGAGIVSVTNRFDLEAGAVVWFSRSFAYDRTDTPPKFPLFDVAASAAESGFPDLSAVTLEFPNITGSLLSNSMPAAMLVAEDLPDGGWRVFATYRTVVDICKAQLRHANPFAQDASAYLSDGASEFDSAKDYYCSSSYSIYVYPNGGNHEGPYVFPGHCLYLNNTWFSVHWNDITFDLVVGGKGVVRPCAGVGKSYALRGTMKVVGSEKPYSEYVRIGDQAVVDVASTLSGSGNLAFCLYADSTGDPANLTGTAILSGDNRAYTGSILVYSLPSSSYKASFEDRGLPAFVPSAVSNVTLRVSRPENLGGALASFAFDSLVISNQCRLAFLETATFDEPTRGWLFADKEYLHVADGKVVTVKNTITYGAELVKEGGGMLKLASKPRFYVDGESSDLPNGAKITVESGLLGAAVANAFGGLELAFQSGTGLCVPIEGIGEGRGVDLTDVTVTAPEGLAVFFDTTAKPERPEKSVVTPVCTLPADSPLLSALRVGQKVYKGTRTTLTQQANDDGTVSVFAITERTGGLLLIR